MRKALVLLVAAATAAVLGGLFIPSTAIKAGASTLSAAELQRELRAIATTPSFGCYLAARDLLQSDGEQAAPPITGASSEAWSTGAVVEWGNIRTTQLVLDSYVARHDLGAFSDRALGAASTALAQSIDGAIEEATAEASQNGSSFSCASEKSGEATLAALPAWFRDQQVYAEAGTLGLASLVPKQIATSGPGLAAWYAANATEFDTTCLSYLQVATATVANEVVAKVDAGMTMATAIDRYSPDPSELTHHGDLGCFSPTSQDWSSVVEYVGDLKVGQATAVQSENSEDQAVYVILSPTKRTHNAFASIESAVAAQAHELNVQSTQVLATAIQSNVHVSVSPWIGTWVATSLGGTITAPATPPATAILNAAANAPAS
jgi:hypothetical protein